MDLKSFLIANVKSDEYYQRKFPEWNPRARPNVVCPFHEDRKASFAVSLKGGGAKCHASGCSLSFGNIIHFEAESTGASERLASRNIYSQFIHKIVAKDRIDRFQTALEGKLGLLKKDCGLSESTANRFHLGWNANAGRITIPIYSRFGFPTNIRLYQLPSHRTRFTQAKFLNEKGFGYLELFPWPSFSSYTPSKPLFWMKGEKDTMLAIQMGLQAFCLLNGESTWMDEITEVFKDFDIAICGDNDEAGLKGSAKRFALLQNAGNKFYTVLALPFSKKTTRLKDFADWILYDNGTKDDLLNLWHDASRPKPKALPSLQTKLKLPEKFSDEYFNLVEIGRRPDMLNRIVKVKGIVSAKTDKTYTIPFRFYISTPSSPKREWQVPIGRELLNLIRRSDEQVEVFIKRHLLGNPKCKTEVIEHITGTEVELIPVITPDKDSPFVTQRSYFFGQKIEANVPYDMEIIPTTDMRTQETVGIITSAKPISRMIESFHFSEEELNKLNVFRPEEKGEGVWDGLCFIANLFSNQFTGIYNREDWHIVSLLTWFSPLQFIFPGEGIQRGWLNTLAIGDTQTGKSEVATKIREVTNSGVFVNAENCTYVGLVGGAIKMASGQFMLRWGKIPINNRQLVVIEELSGLSLNEISNLSEIRSSGLARLDKGGLSSETSARTRLLCLSNVRGAKNRSLANYISGVRAIQDLIGQPEDIARFDLICTLTDREVSADVINRSRLNDAKSETISKEAFQLLVKFVWSLAANQIEITNDAYHLCLEETMRLAKVYHPSIPLFKSGSGRFKIARLACAIACFQFNWNGKKIIVETSHVEAATRLLQQLYDKESCGYRNYSEQMYHRENIHAEDKTTQDFKDILPTPDRRNTVFSYLLHATQFTVDELTQVGGLQYHQSNKLIGRMIGSNIVRKGEANVWIITHGGKIWIEKFLKNGASPSTLHLNGKRYPIKIKSSTSRVVTS